MLNVEYSIKCQIFIAGNTANLRMCFGLIEKDEKFGKPEIPMFTPSLSRLGKLWVAIDETGYTGWS